MKIVIQNTKEDGTVEDIDVTEKINKENGFSVSTEIITNEDNEKETKLTISCDNVKALGATNNSKIIVTYDATLNEDAVIGSAGNTNDVYLEYSNNPNQSGEGTPETGKTPEDTVIVFTYKTIVNKVDENNAPLAGAKFELYKILSDNSELLINRVTISEDQTSFTFTGLDDGKYVLKETVTPDGYNTIDDIHFEIMATHTVGLDSLNGETESGIVKINNIDFTVDKGEGSYSTDVINNSGATLPETGGIGTKIFYVVGAALVIGAGVLLITRKRMSAR